MEEERRLCFVGITRAMRFLMLTHARFRTVFGQTQPTIPSRFLHELPKDKVQVSDISRDVGWGDDAEDDDVDDEDRGLTVAERREAQEQAHEFAPGTLVRHAAFGVGRVITLTGRGPNAKAQVAFRNGATKTLILQYANLQHLPG
jgi:DNA helicase II / ATP-dependent DNA helicase PcrA